MEDHPTYETGCEQQRPVLPYHVLVENHDPDYSAPSPKHIKAVVRYLGWSGTEVGRRLGVGSRNVRKWMQEKDENRPAIPYASWQLLLIYAGIVDLVWRDVGDVERILRDGFMESMVTDYKERVYREAGEEAP